MYIVLFCHQLNANFIVHKLILLVTWQNSYYRPQRSWAKVTFLQVCVILFTGYGVSASVHAGIPHPPEQTPPREDTPGVQTPPREDTPLEQRSSGAETPWSRHPPWEADYPQHTVNPQSRDTSLVADILLEHDILVVCFDPVYGSFFG